MSCLLKILERLYLLISEFCKCVILRKHKKPLFDDTPSINWYRVQNAKNRFNQCKIYRQEIRKIFHKSDKFAVFQQKSSLIVPTDLTPDKYILGQYKTQSKQNLKDLQQFTSKSDLYGTKQKHIPNSPQKAEQNVTKEILCNNQMNDSQKLLEKTTITTQTQITNDTTPKSSSSPLPIQKQDIMILNSHTICELFETIDPYSVHNGYDFKTMDKHFIWISLNKFSDYIYDFKQTISEKVENLIKINDPTILRIFRYAIGNYHDKLSLIIFSEYCKEYTLQILFRKGRRLNSIEKLIIIYGIASGMSILHSHDIIHLNLSPESILLGYMNHPKIGFYNFFDDNSIELSKSLNFKPPEFFQKKKALKKAMFIHLQ